MIDLILVRFLRDHTPYRTGMTASFSPAVAEGFKKSRIVEIIGPLSEDVKEVKPARAKLEK